MGFFHGLRTEPQEDDTFGAAFGYGNISNKPREALEADPNVTVISDYESVLQLNYPAIRRGFSVVPALQYIWNPGGRVENPSTPGEPKKTLPPSAFARVSAIDAQRHESG